MSNEITPANNKILAAMEKQMLQIADRLPDLMMGDDDALDFGGAVFNRLTLKNGAWRVSIDGEEKALDDRKLRVVIARSGRTIGRRAFADDWSAEADAASPVCWSNDGATPAEAVAAPQHSNCKACPWAQKGSGGAGTAKCGLRLPTVAVVEQFPDTALHFQVNATSLFGDSNEKGMSFSNWARYLNTQNAKLRQIANKRVDGAAFVLEMTPDPDGPIGCVKFNPVGLVDGKSLLHSTVVAAREEFQQSDLVVYSGAPADGAGAAFDDEVGEEDNSAAELAAAQANEAALAAAAAAEKKAAAAAKRKAAADKKAAEAAEAAAEKEKAAAAEKEKEKEKAAAAAVETDPLDALSSGAEATDDADPFADDAALPDMDTLLAGL